MPDCIVFHRASYCVVAACDVSDDHIKVAPSKDDYLWIKLCQMKEQNIEEHVASHKRDPYSELQELVLEKYGNFNYLPTPGKGKILSFMNYFYSLPLS